MQQVENPAVENVRPSRLAVILDLRFNWTLFLSSSKLGLKGVNGSRRLTRRFKRKGLVT